MPITDYVSYLEIRTTLGLASDELSDTTLAAPIYASVLFLAMAAITPTSLMPASGTFKARYTAVAAILEASRTADEQKFYDLCHMYFVYSVAHEVAVSLSNRTPKIKADGKASLTRFASEATFRDTLSAVKDRLSSITQQLSQFGSTAAYEPTLLAVVSPSVDPVTGE